MLEIKEIFENERFYHICFVYHSNKLNRKLKKKIILIQQVRTSRTVPCLLLKNSK